MQICDPIIIQDPDPWDWIQGSIFEIHQQHVCYQPVYDVNFTARNNKLNAKCLLDYLSALGFGRQRKSQNLQSFTAGIPQRYTQQSRLAHDNIFCFVQIIPARYTLSWSFFAFFLPTYRYETKNNVDSFYALKHLMAAPYGRFWNAPRRIHHTFQLPAISADLITSLSTGGMWASDQARYSRNVGAAQSGGCSISFILCPGAWLAATVVPHSSRFSAECIDIPQLLQTACRRVQNTSCIEPKFCVIVESMIAWGQRELIYRAALSIPAPGSARWCTQIGSVRFLVCGTTRR